MQSVKRRRAVWDNTIYVEFSATSALHQSILTEMFEVVLPPYSPLPWSSDSGYGGDGSVHVHKVKIVNESLVRQL